MNAITSNQHFPLCKLHKTKARDKAITAIDIVLYNWARNLPLHRGFTPITNAAKIGAGHHRHYALLVALTDLRRRLSARYLTNGMSVESFRSQLGITADQADQLITAVDATLQMWR